MEQSREIQKYFPRETSDRISVEDSPQYSEQFLEDPSLSPLFQIDDPGFPFDEQIFDIIDTAIAEDFPLRTLETPPPPNLPEDLGFLLANGLLEKFTTTDYAHEMKWWFNLVSLPQ